MEKTNNKVKKIILLVGGIVLALAMLAGGLAAVLLMNMGFGSNQAEYSGKVQAQDEETLRAALKSKDDCQIVLTDDIVVTRELEVFGNKKISGGSIIMDMRREGSGESALSVQKGAKLVLDDVIIDGNSVVNCVGVKAGGELESLSCSLLYGYPYGLDVSGKVTIHDILIDEALHTGISVAIFGEVDMLGGAISHNVYGIAVAEEASMDMAEGVSMTKSAASFIVNYGTMKIQGGKYDGSNDNAIENWGTMDIRGTAEKPIEICNGGKSGINAKNNAKLTAEHINIYNMEWHGMCVEKNTKATLKNISFDTTGKSTLYVNSAKATIENISVVNGVSYGIYGTKNAEVIMTNVTIKDMGHRAVVNELSILTADGLVIENSVQHGVYTTGDNAVTTVNNATITGTERGGFAVAKGKGILTNSHIADTVRECVSIAEPGTAIIENCTVDNAGNFGVGCYGGAAEVKNTTFTNTKNASILVQDGGTVTGVNLTIKNSAKQAIRAEKGGVANVAGCSIDTTGAASVYAEGGQITLRSAVINNPKTTGVASKNCKKEYGQFVQAENVTINNSAEYGLWSLNGYIVATDVTVNDPGIHGIYSLNGYMGVTNVTVNNPKRCGVYSGGAESIIHMDRIKVNNAGTCGLGFNGAKEITAKNVTIESPTNEGIYAFNSADVKMLDNITINNPGSHGISVDGEAKLNVVVDASFNPDNTTGNGVTILNATAHGIRVKGATVSVTGATITDAKLHGVYGEADSQITLNKCAIASPGRHGIAILESAGADICETTITNAGERGLYNEGKLTLTSAAEGRIALAIDTAADHGVYLGAKARVEGSGLTVKNVGNNAIFSEGADITLDGLIVANIAKQGIQLKGGTVRLSNIHISQTTNAAVYVRNDVKLTLDNGIISAYGIGLATTDEAQAVVKHVTIEKGTKGEEYSTNVLVNGEKNSRIDLQSGTKLDGKGKTGDGVNVVSSTASVILNGVSFVNIADDSAAVCLQSSDTTIKVSKALTEAVSLKPSTYMEDLPVAEKAGEISDADFEASLELLIPVNTDWKVNSEGCLTNPGNAVASIGKKTYATLEAAVAAANASEGADTIQLLADVVEVSTLLTITSDITITADKAVTIQASEEMKSSMLYVTGGKLTVTGASADAKLTIAASTKSQSLVKLNGGDAELTNVHLKGDAASTVAVTSGNSIHNEKGVLTATNVLLTDCRGDGIYIKAGASAKLDNVTIDKTGRYGIKTYGTVNIYNALSISNTEDNVIDVDKAGKVISNFENVPAGTYAIIIDTARKDSARGIIVRAGGELDITHISIQNVKHNGVDLLAATSVASICDAAVAAEGYGISAVANSSLTLGNVTLTGSPAGLNLAENVKIELNKALTQNITVQLGAYAEGAVVAQKAGGISNADFAVSMSLLIPADTNWIVDATGKLAKSVCEHDWAEQITAQPTCAEVGEKTYTCSNCGSSYTEVIPATGHTATHVAFVAPTLETAGNIEYWYCSVCNTYWSNAAQTEVVDAASVILPPVTAGNVVYMNGEAFQTMEAAVAKANETAAADTIYLLCDSTVSAQLKVTTHITIKAVKAVTVQTSDSVTGSVIYVTGGSLTVTGASEDAKITIAASKKSQSLVKLAGGDVNLTNVALLGNKASTAADKTVYGIFNEGGKVTAKNVIVQDITKGDGIYIKAGTSADLDNVTITNISRYGLKTYGTVNIYNTVHPEKALSISNTTDHAIDIDKAGKVISHFENVPAGTYAITIDTTQKDSARGVIVRGGGALNVTHISIKNVMHYGVDIFASSATGTISNFKIEGTGKASVYVAGTATLTGGTICSAIEKAAGATVNQTNVTVQN